MSQDLNLNLSKLLVPSEQIMWPSHDVWLCFIFVFGFFMIGMWDNKESHQFLNKNCCICIYSMETLLLLGHILCNTEFLILALAGVISKKPCTLVKV